MKRPTQRMAYNTTEGIPRICRKGECVVVDPKLEGILVGRWVSWSELDHFMSHEASLCVDEEYYRRRANRSLGVATEEKRETTATENRYLRLKFDGQYNSGDPFKDFELLADAPEIPVTRLSDVTPRHAIRGDVLREEYDDQLTPFQLRRDGKRIGDPEWWQVRHLFVGLKEGVPKGDVAEEIPPHHRQALQLLGGSKRCLGAYVVERDVPEVAIEVGDLIVHAWKPDSFPEMGGRVRWLSMDDYSTLRAATLDSYGATFTFLTGVYEWDPDALHRFLTHPGKWGKKLKVWHSRLAVVRSRRSPVGEPLEATSDAAALFELIHSTGGKMPIEFTED